MTRDFGAILLAGGRARRLGGATKPLLEVGGRTLLQHAAAAAASISAAPVTVVSDPIDPSLEVSWVRENPAFAGPAAAVVAALRSWCDPLPEWTLLLACDLPHAAAAVAQLRADLDLIPDDADGVCLADDSGRPQWLTGVYRTRALRDAAFALADAGRDLPVRILFDDAAITVVRDRSGGSADVDTWEDLKRARAREGRDDDEH